MMKKIILIVLSVFIVLPAFSQVKFGLKAGLSTTSLKMEDVKTLISGETEYVVDVLKGANYGFHGGAFVRFGLSWDFIFSLSFCLHQGQMNIRQQILKIRLQQLSKNSSSISSIFRLCLASD